MLKKLIALVVAMIIVLSFTACSSDKGENKEAGVDSSNEPIEWTMSTIYSDPAGGDITYKSLSAGMQHFIDEVNEKSEGRLVIKGFYGAILGSANDTFQQMERGEIDVYYGQPMSTIDKKFAVWSIPFLFTNYEDIQEVVVNPDGEFYKESAKLLEPHNAILLSIGGGNIRGLLNTKHEVGTIDDVRDLKVRTYEDTIVNSFWKSICNATPISISEVYTSLQTNGIDGLEFSADSIISRKYYEVAKYYSDINWQWANGASFVVNKKAYESLPEDLQKIVSDAAWTSAEFQAEHALSDMEKAVNTLQDEHEVIVHNLTDEERQTWIDYADSISDDFKNAVGEELYNKMRKLAQDGSK
jgi:TRAP-type C4-dicarboxylate transport system substrate-binding protein